jgi:hypothetical protein
MINNQLADSISRSGTLGLGKSLQTELVHQVLPHAGSSGAAAAPNQVLPNASSSPPASTPLSAKHFGITHH